MFNLFKVEFHNCLYGWETESRYLAKCSSFKQQQALPLVTLFNYTHKTAREWLLHYTHLLALQERGIVFFLTIYNKCTINYSLIVIKIKIETIAQQGSFNCYLYHR